jgi:hypothetical protein
VRRDALPLLGFAAVSSLLDALLWWYGPPRLAGLLLVLPVALAVIAAAVVALPAAAAGDVRRVPELSLPTAVAAVACVVAGAGVIFGLWLILIGAGLAAGAVAGIARELRAAPGGRR